MKMWLTFKLFGGGFGLGQPYFDGAFYWLVDTEGKQRAGRNGRFYSFSYGLGAQLTSFEWFAPKAGTRRRLAGTDFRVFQVSRTGPMVRVSWAMTGMGKSLDDDHAKIAALRAKLNSPMID